MSKGKSRANAPTKRVESEAVAVIEEVATRHGATLELKRGRRHLRARLSLGGQSVWLTISGSPRGGIDYSTNYARQQSERAIRMLKGDPSG